MKQWREKNPELASGYSMHDPNIKVKLGEIDPEEYRDGTSTLQYGFAQGPFGEFFVALAPDGIVGLKFTDGKSEEVARSFMERRGYCWVHRDSGFANMLKEIFLGHNTYGTIRVGVDGTPFQKKVWGTLLSIPFGETITYRQLAERVGNPKAVRAVASAVAKNYIAYLIPCHRVVRSDGSAGEYRWGAQRKAQMIAWEKEMKERLAKEGNVTESGSF
jgi:AraC family transcriptional regulator of adaptative response/methylated-DNA-[protein]-cysteine methyltransferase